MTIYEFYITYILTGKAVFLCANLTPLRVSTYGANLRLDYRVSVRDRPLDIPWNQAITYLSKQGIKIFLLSDPIFVEASTLTGVISIPVPEPDDLPF